jgi:hypothetical protein
MQMGIHFEFKDYIWIPAFAGMPVVIQCHNGESTTGLPPPLATPSNGSKQGGFVEDCLSVVSSADALLAE